MATGYEKFKTPFYEIFVAPASSNDYIPLPEQVRRLIKKVEIMETRETCSYNQQVTIVITEGSREPFSLLDESVPTEVYSLGEAGGALTNKSGLVTDLRYIEDGVGITAVSKGAAAAALNALASLAASGENAVGPPDEATLVQSKQPKTKPQYLFQEFNKLKIRWGYLEDPTTVRTIKTIIYITACEFPEGGQPETTLTCLGSGAVLNQIASPKAINFAKKTPSGIDPKTGNLLVTFEGMNVKEVVEYIGEQIGIVTFVDDNLNLMPIDKGKFRVIPAGKNIDRYLTELAQETNSHYIPMLHPATDEFVIFFISQKEMEASLGEYLVYKGPGSILKSVNIKADFSGFFGSYVSAYNSSGQKNSATADIGDNQLVLFDDSGKADNNPASGNSFEVANQAAVIFGNGAQTSTAEIHPSAVNKSHSDQYSLNNAKCLSNRIVSMELITLGYTRLAPPKTLKITNIGERYSGVYNLLSVTHTLDENGYHCKCMATSYSIRGGGVVPANASTPTSPPEQKEINVFQPLASNSASSTIIQDYNDVIYAQA